jgi:pyridinium-3,5-bisthiocarboxylic acid mononucleotide nickel chelatase
VITFGRLHVEPIGGVAGDMLLGALIDLGADAAAIRAAFTSLQEPGLRLDVSRVEVQGLTATYVRSLAPHEGHVHRHLSDIMTIIDAGDMSEVVKARARDIFTLLAEAEARVHGGVAGDVHLHEVGELDSILDVVGISVALELLGNPSVTSAPLPVGSGTVHTSHGELGVPVPAVREIAARAKVPLSVVPVVGETVTPTGIAVLAAVCESFGEAPGRPVRTGIGAGTRRFPDRPNVIKVHGLAQ